MNHNKHLKILGRDLIPAVALQKSPKNSPPVSARAPPPAFANDPYTYLFFVGMI